MCVCVLEKESYNGKCKSDKMGAKRGNSGVSLPSVKDIAKSLKWAFCTLQQRERKQAVAKHFSAHTMMTYMITRTHGHTHIHTYMIA